jgi:hypothetical protein
MQATLSPPADEPQFETSNADELVTLADGRRVALGAMSVSALQQLQWEQEQLFAQAIVRCPKGSSERGAVVGQAYDTICKILAAQAGNNGQPLVMGLDPRYVQLVLNLLRGQTTSGMHQPWLFEIGYGSGALLAEVRDHGYPVGGIEVSSMMRQQSTKRLGERHA